MCAVLVWTGLIKGLFKSDVERYVSLSNCFRVEMSA